MNAWIVPVLASISTLLIVSVTYIAFSLRHKQRMTLLEKSLPPDHFKEHDHMLWIRLGMLLMGVGVGFLLAFLIDLYVFDSRNGTEPLYPSLTAICGGLAMILSKRLNSKTTK